MQSRTILIATGAIALALGLVGTRSAVADGTLVQSTSPAGEPITLTFSPEGFLSAKLMTTTPLADEAAPADGQSADDALVRATDGPDDGTLQVLSSSGDGTVSSDGSALSILMGSGSADVSVLRHDETSSTRVNVTINGEDVPASELPGNDINVRTENTGTLDGDVNENEVDIDRDVEIDIENDNETELDIDRDIEAGDNDIEGEEQDVGDIRPGDVNVDLRGL